MSFDTQQGQDPLQFHGRCIDPSVVDIFDLIASRKWQRLRAAIFMQKSTIAKCARLSALHYACQFCPPLDIIRGLHKAYPRSVFEKDCKQGYPLHVACKYGCSFDVINFLLEKNMDAAKRADGKGRAPFLLLFKSFVHESGLDWNTANRELIKIARLLVKAAPMSPIMQDCYDMTAVEYAITQENDISSIKYVQFESKRITKEIMQSMVCL